MTPNMTPKDLAGLGAPSLVYVRPIGAAEVIALSRDSDLNGIVIDPDATLYAVHGADGERLAVMTDRKSAFAAALAHELQPVFVH